MKLVDTAIAYRPTVIVLTVLVCLGGIFSYVTLPKEANPSIEIPTIVVTTLYPGASPSDIENLITQVIEQEVQSVNGIEEIRSTSVEGVSTILVEFTPDVDLDDATQKVRDKVDLAKPDLPADVEEPIISEIDFSEFPIMTVNLAADYPLAQLKEVAEDLQDELEALASVLEVDRVGGLEREVQVDVNLEALQGFGLALSDLVDTIRNENTNLPGGSIDVDRMSFLIRVDGQFERPSQIEDLVVTSFDERPVLIRDVAEVRFGFEEAATYARLGILREELEFGELRVVEDQSFKQVISLNVKKRSGDNILIVANEVDEVIEDFAFPPGTEVLITGDQSEQVETLVKDLENNIISGLLFVVAVLLFFLGVRTSVLVGVAIPLSMFVSFVVFMAMGQTLNFIILFSLIIALGMLVDNAVVIVENIYRYREQGVERWEAARRATNEVGTAVVASTATTVAAFVPMLFWPGIIGEFMGYMPYTLIVTLSASLFVALVINPVITGLFMQVDGADGPVRRPPGPIWAARGIGAVLLVLVALTNWVSFVVLTVGGLLSALVYRYALQPVAGGFVRTGLPRLVARYRVFLTWMLRRDYQVRRGLLRNALGLGSFAGGLGGLVLGGLLFVALGPAPAMVVLVPAGLCLVVGLIGIVVHCLEVMALGRGQSIRAGAAAGLGVLVLMGLMSLATEKVDFSTVLSLLLVPLLMVVMGAIGALLLGDRKQLFLTDNRARLMNGVLGMLLAIVVMFAVAPTGVEFFPDTDPNQVRVVATGPVGQNIETSNRVAKIIQDRLLDLFGSSPETEENVKNLVVNVGIGGDALFGGGSESAQESSVTLNLVDFEARNESSSDTLARVRERLQGLPGIELEIQKDDQGPPTGPPVNIEIVGPSFEELMRLAEEVKARLRVGVEEGELEGLVDVRDNLDTGRPELQVDIDRARVAQFGLSTLDVATNVRTAIQGEEASTWRTGEDEYDIRVRLREEDRSSLDSLEGLMIHADGKSVPLVSVADLTVGGSLGSLTRLDLERVAVVEGDASPGVNAQELLGRVQTYLQPLEADLPSGYALQYTGENEEQQESFAFLSTALAVGVSLISMILIAQFNSVMGPLIIMIAVGLSMIGVQLGLILTRTPFGLFSFIGIISLAGIVVNNNIVLIDYTVQLRDRGMEKQAAIIEAGATRLRPVILTAFTTVLGLIPLTFGINIDFVGLLTRFDPNFQIGSANTQFWGPMGTAIISGLTFATFLTLVIVPVMYSLLDSTAARVQRWITPKPNGKVSTAWES
ncbi:MAG: efflux RND transporter permease subunit [Myxococcota bacterium]